MSTVVVGIDGSEVATEALRFAAREAQWRGARLLVVHADEDTERHARGGTQVQDFAAIVREEAITLLADIAPDLDSEVRGQAGDPAQLLIYYSDGADLLVVGTHRMGRLRGWVLGSVSQQVAAHARCPVATVSGPVEHADGAVVVGVSAEEGGLAALRFACEEARRRGVPVHAIRAIAMQDWTALGYGYPVAVDADVLESTARAHLSRALEVAHTEFPDVVIDGELSRADVFVALHRAATTAPLVVIGSRRPEDAVLPHLGPVAAWLLHQAPCPLVVVPFPQKAQEAEVPVAAAETSAATT
ncbi:MAG: universal stress protein [Jatrophihabitans sp.]|uniref:universal stress protein n=1 Tax=Jatrophihabitans sp. TaxID=1932789 RepID=UPI003F7D5950